MGKLRSLLIGTVCCALLSACTVQEEEPVVWKQYRSGALGVTFQYPTPYVPRLVQDDMVDFGSGKIAVRHAYLRSGPAESAFIEVWKSRNARVLDLVQKDHPFQTRQIGAVRWKYAVQEGMGTPVTYVLQERPWMFLTFVFPPDQKTIDTMLQSVKVL